MESSYGIPQAPSWNNHSLSPQRPLVSAHWRGSKSPRGTKRSTGNLCRLMCIPGRGPGFMTFQNLLFDTQQPVSLDTSVKKGNWHSKFRNDSYFIYRHQTCPFRLVVQSLSWPWRSWWHKHYRSFSVSVLCWVDALSSQTPLWPPINNIYIVISSINYRVNQLRNGKPGAPSTPGRQR